MMKTFHRCGTGASNQLRTKTIPKKIAKSIVGNSNANPYAPRSAHGDDRTIATRARHRVEGSETTSGVTVLLTIQSLAALRPILTASRREWLELD
jgi:hypothetical protein